MAASEDTECPRDAPQGGPGAEEAASQRVAEETVAAVAQAGRDA